MKIRLLALDLDGTVLHNDKTISSYTLSVLRRCKEAGIRVAVATARSEQAAQRYLQQLCPDLIIVNGGAQAKQGDTAFYSCKLSASVSDAIVAQLLEWNNLVSISVHTDAGYYVSWERESTGDYAHAIRYDFSTPLSQETYKITAQINGSGSFDALERAYVQCRVTPFSDSEDDTHWFRISHRGATKLNAVAHAAKQIGCCLPGVAAFGDDYTDLEMLRGCGIGIAMGNAIDEVKAVADEICGTNDEDGVARWLERHLL